MTKLSIEETKATKFTSKTFQARNYVSFPWTPLADGEYSAGEMARKLFSRSIRRDKVWNDFAKLGKAGSD